MSLKRKINYAICRLISILTGSNDDMGYYKNIKKFTFFNRASCREQIILADYTNANFGLADRITGILSLYMLSKESNRNFKIHHPQGFNLIDYLHPNTTNWVIDSHDISYGLNESRPIIAKLSRRKLATKGLPKLDPKILQYHAYTNLNFEEFDTSGALSKYNRHVLFHELFKPSLHLENLLKEAISTIGSTQYIAVHMRFMNFFEQVEPTVLERRTRTEHEKNGMISLIRHHLSTIHNHYPDKIILLFTDSNHILQETFPKYVKTLPGRVGHICAPHEQNDTITDKAFTDLFMISKALMVINIAGKHLRHSGFSRLAAEIGNIPFIVRKEEKPEAPIYV